MKIISFSTLFLTFLFMIGCSSKKAESTPPKIILGEDPCDNCLMIINETKYAATVRLNNGEAKRFDDIGCLLTYADKNKDEIKYYWVYDFNLKKAVPAKDAFYVKSKDNVTPMGGGILAFSKRTEAESYAKKENASVKIFKDLIK